jgi:hypothetical protein
LKQNNNNWDMDCFIAEVLDANEPSVATEVK